MEQDSILTPVTDGTTAPSEPSSTSVNVGTATPRLLSELEDDHQREGIRYNLSKERLYATKHWYAVYCTPNHEFQIGDYLMGREDQMKKVRRGSSKKENFFVQVDPEKVRMECFVPSVFLHLKYSDRMVWKEKVATPGIIFVRCKLNERDPLFYGPVAEYITGFINDRVRHWPMPIPDEQMEVFRAAIEAEYAISVERPTFAPGDRVLVLEGALNGRVAEVVENRERVIKNEYRKDRQGQLVLDADGNPIPVRKQTLCIRLNAELVALFEVDADKVVPAPQGAPDYGVYE